MAAFALTLVHAPSAEVHAALTNYLEIRPKLLTDEFGDYEVLAGGQGAGTQVRWTLALEEAIRNRKGKAPKKQKGPPRECVIRVVESDADRIVEQDTKSTLVTTWTLQPPDDATTAVRVDVTWDHPGGLFARQAEQFAIRAIYEDLLTKLHDHFEVDEAGQVSDETDPDAADPDAADPDAPDPDAADPETDPGTATRTD